MTTDATVRVAEALRDGLPPALYRVAGEVAADRLRNQLADPDAAVFYLPGETITDKASFIDACATAFRFPSTFGRNWDALADSLGDLEWVKASRYVVIYHDPARFAQSSPTDWAMALDIFRDTVSFWTQQKTTMWILFTGRIDGLDSIPKLDGASTKR